MTNPNIPIDLSSAERVVMVHNRSRVVINRGSEHGVKEGQLYLVYTIGPDVSDPVTGESLGKLEVIRGRGRVIHVQERIATLQCVKDKPREALEDLFGIGLIHRRATMVREEDGFFIDAEENDLVRKIG